MRGALVLGDLCLDVDVEQGSRHGYQFEARSLRLCPAGSGGNFAIALSSTGLDAVIASPVSRDPVLSLLRSMMGVLGVRLEEIHGNGGTCTIVNIYRAGRPRRAYYHAGPRASIRGVVERLTVMAEELGHLHITGYLLELVPPIEVEPLLSRDRGYTVSIDLHPRAGALGGELPSILEKADYVMGTTRELRSLGQRLGQTARTLVEKGAKCVVAKSGALGARAYCRDGAYKARPPRVEPVMLKGAGDVLAAYFIAGVALGKSHRESLEDAVKMAAEHVAGRGPLNKAWSKASAT